MTVSIVLNDVACGPPSILRIILSNGFCEWICNRFRSLCLDCGFEVRTASRSSMVCLGSERRLFLPHGNRGEHSGGLVAVRRPGVMICKNAMVQADRTQCRQWYYQCSSWWMVLWKFFLVSVIESLQLCRQTCLSIWWREAGFLWEDEWQNCFEFGNNQQLRRIWSLTIL